MLVYVYVFRELFIQFSFLIIFYFQWMLHRFLFDVGSKIFVWTGKKANSSDKVAALGAADRYAAIEPRANDVPVTILKGT